MFFKQLNKKSSIKSNLNSTSTVIEIEMLQNLLQMGGPLNGKIGLLVLMVVFVGVDILLLKLGLTITKAQKRTRMKWVAVSFLIQFGVIVIISSPMFLLGFAGVFNGNPGVIIPIIILCTFIDLNVINVIHQVGLKRSLVVVLLIIVPIVFIMVNIGNILSGPTGLP